MAAAGVIGGGIQRGAGGVLTIDITFEGHGKRQPARGAARWLRVLLLLCCGTSERVATEGRAMVVVGGRGCAVRGSSLLLFWTCAFIGDQRALVVRALDFFGKGFVIWIDAARGQEQLS